jgi:hypothetical protein
MDRWLVRLDGEESVLVEFPRWFPDGEVFSFREGDCFYLSGQVFDVYTEPKDVYEKTIEIVEEYSAIISVLCPRFSKPTVTTIFHENSGGIRKQHCFVFGGFACIKIQATGDEKPLKTEAHKLLEITRTDSQLMLVLYLWCDTPRTWPRLYRILEEIECYLGNKRICDVGLCANSQRERFRRTSNSAEVAGKDARHAVGKFKPPDKPMTLDEAVKFINALIYKLTQLSLKSQAE